jgi:predicted DNA-binding transcriptional regulator YafY
MRRADRLFQIIEMLRGKKAVTAQSLADQLHISVRTLYRDVADLIASGVPIEGEAGVGYMLRRGFDLPPIMFDRDEIEAVVAGARFVQSLAGTELGAAAQRVLSKVEAVLPSHRRAEMEKPRLYASSFSIQAAQAKQLDRIRQAINSRNVLSFAYQREDGEHSTRTVWPLSLMYWPPRCLLGGWCEMREDFRVFRLDRMTTMEMMVRTFTEEPGRSFNDFVRAMRHE